MQRLLIVIALIGLIDQTPVPPIIPATREFTTAELRVGDVLIISHPERKKRLYDEIAADSWYPAAVGNHKDVRELEEWIGKDRRVQTTMPSGARLYPIREETAVVIDQIIPADGKLSDTDILAVRPLEGEHAGRILWVRNLIVMVPLPKPTRGPDPKSAAASALALGDRLSQIGRQDLANQTYRNVLRNWPRSVEAKLAQKRLH